MATIHLCSIGDCDNEATKGRFGREFCEDHYEIIRAEREADKQARKEERRASGAATRTAGGPLDKRIKDAVMMTSAVAAIGNPNIYIAVEATVDEFALAWANVAKTSPTARKYIEALLTGGVWIQALGATLVMAVTTLAVCDKLPPSLYPLGNFCVSKAGLVAVAAPPSANGNGPGVAPEPEPVIPPEADSGA